MLRVLLLSLVVSLTGCSKTIDYDPQEERWFCHLKYDQSQWWGVEHKLPIWLCQDHVRWHPNDYWGKCTEKDLKGRKDE